MSLVFVSYSRRDLMWVDEQQHPKTAILPWLAKKLAHSGIEIWWDSNLKERVGDDYKRLIQERIDGAQVAVLLLSDDFFISPFICQFELPLIKERVDSGHLQLFPIIVSHLDWDQNEYSRWIKSRQIHPAALRPLIEIESRPAQWAEVRSKLAVALREQVERAQRATSRHTSVPAPVGGEATEPATAERSRKPLLMLAGAAALSLGAWGAFQLMPRNPLDELNRINRELGTLAITMSASEITSARVADLGELARSTEAVVRRLDDRNTLSAQICKAAQQLSDAGYRLFKDHKKAGLDVLRVSVAVLADPADNGLKCDSDTTWRVHHYYGELAASLGTPAEKATGRKSLDVALRIATAEADKSNPWIISQRINTSLVLARLTQTEGDIESTRRLLRDVFHLCHDESISGSAAAPPLITVDFPNSENVKSVCSEAKARLASIQTVAEQQNQESALAQAIKHAESAATLGVEGDGPGVRRLVESALESIAVLTSPPLDATRIFEARILALIADGYASIYRTGAPDHGMLQLRRAVLASRNPLVGEYHRYWAAFELARTWRTGGNDPIRNEAIAHLKSNPRGAGTREMTVYSYIVLAEIAQRDGRRDEAAGYWKLALMALTDSTLQNNLDEAGATAARQRAEQGLSETTGAE